MVLKIRHTYKRELRKQIRMAIAAAVGFIIAYSWRDFILGVTKGIIESFTAKESAHLVSFYSSLLITLIGAGIIILSARMLREKK